MPIVKQAGILRHVVKNSIVKPSTRLRALEFRVWRAMQELDAVGNLPRHLLIACSGGMDSMALMECLWRVAPRLGLRLTVVSVHHGHCLAKRQKRAREQAFDLVRSEARARGLRFFGIRRDRRLKELRSEEELRDFRRAGLAKLSRRLNCDAQVFAHHADDLLETRLIRLVRGTGAQGLAAMRVIDEGVLRPFLNEPRKAILEYAKESQLKWFDDPSNQDHGPLRNWIRHSWLAELEQKRPGATKALGRSLQLVVEELQSSSSANLPMAFTSLDANSFVIDLGRYQKMSLSEKRRGLARQVHDLGVRNFSAAHLEEAVKRLGYSENFKPTKVRRNAKRRDFNLLGLSWKFNAEQVRVARS